MFPFQKLTNYMASVDRQTHLILCLICHQLVRYHVDSIENLSNITKTLKFSEESSRLSMRHCDLSEEVEILSCSMFPPSPWLPENLSHTEVKFLYFSHDCCFHLIFIFTFFKVFIAAFSTL